MDVGRQAVRSDDAAAIDSASSRSRDQMLLDNLSEVVYRGTDDGTLEWVSPSVEHLLGWTPEELIGSNAMELLHPADRETVLRQREGVTQNGSGQAQMRMATKDGGYKWVEARVSLVKDDNSGVWRVGTWRDIDAEHTALEQLRQSEQRFRGAMLSASTGMCLVAPDGSFLEVNDALCALLGQDASTLTAMTWQELTHPDDVQADVTLVQQILDGACDSYRLLKRYLRPDGEIVWGDLSVSCVRNSRGEVEYFVSQITDLTARITAEQKLAETQEQYRLVAENASSFALLTDADGGIAWLSPAALRLSGYDSVDQLTEHPMDYVHPHDRWKVTTAVSAVREGSDVVTQDIRLRHRYGTYSWWSVTVRPSDARHDGRLVFSFLDIDSEIRARLALQESEERYRWLVNNMQDTVVTTDAADRIAFVSGAITDLVGWKPDEIIDKPVLALIHRDDRDAVAAPKRPDGESTIYRARVLMSSGGYLWVEMHGHVLLDDTGAITGGVSVWHDASQAMSREESLRRMAGSDPLTGLPNRRELLIQLDEMLHQRRQGEHVAVVFCDVDDLKQINDEHGHQAGDITLQSVANRIVGCLRADDLVARLGGDEVVVGLRGSPTGDDAIETAEKIRRAVASPLGLPDGSTITPTLSVGVITPWHGEDVYSLLDRADEAMYEAKALGGDNVFVRA